MKPELVQEGFVFTEGPVGTYDGGLFFSDIASKTIYHMDPDGKITIARGNTLGANGLALNQSELYAAEGYGGHPFIKDDRASYPFTNAYSLFKLGSFNNSIF